MVFTYTQTNITIYTMKSKRNASHIGYDGQLVPENPHDIGLHILARIVARQIMAKRLAQSAMSNKDTKIMISKDNENLP